MKTISDGFLTLMGGLIFLMAVGGYVANIVKIFGSVGDPLTGMFILRCIGAFFFPIGCIAGFV